jgi:hypothetical protein
MKTVSTSLASTRVISVHFRCELATAALETFSGKSSFDWQHYEHTKTQASQKLKHAVLSRPLEQ